MTATQVAPPETATAARDGQPPLEVVGTPSLWASRELIVNLTRREVSSKYKRTALGHLWSLMNPLSTMLVYTLVFSVILKTQPDRGDPSGLHTYALYLMAALLPWSFFQGAVFGGMAAPVENANLIKKVYFRRDVLVSARVFSTLVTFGFELLVLVVALLAFGGMPLPWLPLVVVLVALLTLFALGLGLLLAVANTYFRDTEHFVAIFFQIWFYLTPIIYPLKNVQSTLDSHHLLGWKLSQWYELNPMARFANLFRDLLYDNHFPDWGDVAYCAVFAAVVLILGSLVFRRFEARLAEEL